MVPTLLTGQNLCSSVCNICCVRICSSSISIYICLHGHYRATALWLSRNWLLNSADIRSSIPESICQYSIPLYLISSVPTYTCALIWWSVLRCSIACTAAFSCLSSALSMFISCSLSLTQIHVHVYIQSNLSIKTAQGTKKVRSL